MAKRLLFMFKKMFDSPDFWGIVLGILMCFLIAHWLECHAQAAVVQRGNTFVQVDSSKSTKIKKDNPTLTKYFYQTTDGTKYPIYMSASGKCFIIKTSQKTGKPYKQYLPEISKKLYGRNTATSK